MRVLSVNTSYVPPAGKEFDASSYPADGLYLQGENLIIRYTPGGALPYITSFLGGARLLSDWGQVPASAQPVESRGVSEDFVLKAMAIAQNPGLAEKLIK